MSIMIVGEAWGDEEEKEGAPFVGSSGSVLNGILQQTGINRDDCYLTNVFNLRPKSGRLDSLCGPKETGISGYRPLFIKPDRYVKEEYQSEIDRLFTEVRDQSPNVIVALGNTALWALTKKSGIKKYRGSPLHTIEVEGRKYKVLPTWHPTAIMRQWNLRVISLADFSKARRESEFPELRRPRRLLYLEPDIRDIEDFYKEFLVGQPFLGCDIETRGPIITEVGYSNAAGDRAIVIPFFKRSGNGCYWEHHWQEKQAWNWVRRINAEFPLVGQNFTYDMKYFWKQVGIPCPKFLDDTMILHHSLQPELEKSLGFLGSIYTNEPSWKFMRTDHSTLKKED